MASTTPTSMVRMDMDYPPPATTGRMNILRGYAYTGRPSIGQRRGLVKRRD